MAKKRLSRDQKRKHKLRERGSHAGAAGASRHSRTADNFKRDTERIIAQTFLSLDQRVLDAHVLAAVNRLVVDVQKRTVAPDDGGAPPSTPTDALVRNLKRHWYDNRTLAAFPGLLAAQTLQSLAERIDSIKAPGESQSYLRFVQGAVQVMSAGPDSALRTVEPAQPLSPSGTDEAGGGTVVVGPEAAVPMPNAWSSDEMRLLELGQAWLRSSSLETWGPFENEAARMTAVGQAQFVANVCQYLYGTFQTDPVERALRPVVDAAHRRLEQTSGGA